MTNKQDNAPPVLLQKNRVEYNFGLVGRCFHTLNNEGGVVQQGIVKSIVGEDKALVQYLEWTITEPGILEIVRLDDMALHSEKDRLHWQFYEDAEHMRFWFEHRYIPGAIMKYDPHQIALDVIARGFAPVPVPRGKSPTLREWQKLRITAVTVNKYFNGANLNVGAIMGPASGDLTDVDLDCKEAIMLAPYFLPKTNLIYGRPSKRRSHYLYRCRDSEPKASIKLNDEKGGCIIELRLGGGGKGAQSLMPGSLHTSGERYEWDENGELASKSCAELKTGTTKIAVGTILIRHWPAQGTRHDTALALGGFLARAGWNADDAEYFVTTICTVHGEAEDPAAHGKTARDSCDRHAAGDPVYGLPQMKEIFGEAAAKQIAKLMKYRARPDIEPGDGKRASFDDFHAYMPQHSYIYVPSREMWPAISVNARIPPVRILDANGDPMLDEEGEPRTIKANTWLDQNRHVEQMTWAPGFPMLIKDRLVSEGGWIMRDGDTCFNLYRPPTIELGDASKAGPWLDHVHKVFSDDDAKHMIPWLAQRVQYPEVKINHALLLGSSAQGTGKDTALEPVKRAIGPWNFAEVSPQQMLGRFNGYLKRVILRINEARDLGDVNRYQFYDHMKAYTAAPPDVLRVDEKNLREHSIFNVVGVILTTNYKSTGIYLPANDRRHYVAWSNRVPADFAEGYWDKLWKWYDAGGDRDVAAYLAELDLSSFDPKAPPPKTAAFWDIVDANRAPEDAELADVLDQLGNPKVTTINQVSAKAGYEFAAWLRERKNRRQIPHRFEQCGYAPVRNPDAKDGLWKIGKERQAVYGQTKISVNEQIAEVRRMNPVQGEMPLKQPKA